MKICIIDFEATCDDNNRNFDMEIIEFGATMFDPAKPDETYYFQSFVKPVVNQTLTPFCTQLTSITQKDVQRADLFPIALGKMKSTLETFYGKDWREHVLFASWGAYDKKQLVKDCQRHHVPFPFNGWHLNIKQEFLEFYHRTVKKTVGVAAAANILGIPFEGTHHRGIDDAKMIAKIFKRMLTDGYQIPTVIQKSLQEENS